VRVVGGSGGGGGWCSCIVPALDNVPALDVVSARRCNPALINRVPFAYCVGVCADSVAPSFFFFSKTDDIQFHTEVTEFVNAESVKKAAAEGALIHGLFLDGASWSRAANTLVESEPKKLFASLPVLYVTAITSHQKKGKAGEYGGFGPAITPVYKYPVRQDRFKIFDVNLPTRDVRPQQWILRGVALLCAKD
jgi:hypothetical protein